MLDFPPVRADDAFMMTTATGTEHALSMENAKAFVLGGNATFTLESAATGARFTFKIRKADNAKIFFVKVLTGSDNENDYTFLGTIFENGNFVHGKKSPISADAPSAKVIAWFVPLMLRGANFSSTRLYHAGRCGRCGRCGRKLTVPESIISGLGPDCAEMGN